MSGTYQIIEARLDKGVLRFTASSGYVRAQADLPDATILVQRFFSTERDEYCSKATIAPIGKRTQEISLIVYDGELEWSNEYKTRDLCRRVTDLYWSTR